MKRLTLEEPENKCTEEGVDRVISRIERSFGHMKVDMMYVVRKNLKTMAKREKYLLGSTHL